MTKLAPVNDRPLPYYRNQTCKTSLEPLAQRSRNHVQNNHIKRKRR